MLLPAEVRHLHHSCCIFSYLEFISYVRCCLRSGECCDKGFSLIWLPFGPIVTPTLRSPTLSFFRVFIFYFLTLVAHSVPKALPIFCFIEDPPTDLPSSFLFFLFRFFLFFPSYLLSSPHA